MRRFNLMISSYSVKLFLSLRVGYLAKPEVVRLLRVSEIDIMDYVR